jgi:hypothetical protein
MAWYQGYTTVANLIQTLSDMLVGGGWELVEMKDPDDRIFKTTTDPEGAIREPVNLQASLTGEPAGGTGLTGDTTYYYAVTAVGPRGESVASAEVSVAQPTTPERVRLSWRRVEGAMHYHIYRRTSTGTLERIGTTDGTMRALCGRRIRSAAWHCSTGRQELDHVCAYPSRPEQT